MSMVLESTMLRRIAHKLLDDVLDYAECLAEEWSMAEGPATPEHRVIPRAAAPDITLGPPVKKPPQPKPAPPPRQHCPDVTISCRSSCGALEIAVNFAAGVAQRLGLKPHGKAALDLHRGKLRVRRAEKMGRAVYSGGPTGRLFFSVWANAYGVTERHAPESCIFQYDLEDALLIEPPSWLKKAAPAPQKPKADPPATCIKLHGTNPRIKCAACQKAPASLQCNLCPTLLCNTCWEPHVRTHWHTEAKDKPAMAARDARQAMRTSR